MINKACCSNKQSTLLCDTGKLEGLKRGGGREAPEGAPRGSSGECMQGFPDPQHVRVCEEPPCAGANYTVWSREQKRTRHFSSFSQYLITKTQQGNRVGGKRST